LNFNNFFSLRKAMKKLNGDCRLISESNEIKLLRRLHHENIIKYFEDFIYNGSTVMIFREFSR
jgi:serine/threonine protein kinase